MSESKKSVVAEVSASVAEVMSAKDREAFDKWKARQDKQVDYNLRRRAGLAVLVEMAREAGFERQEVYTKRVAAKEAEMVRNYKKKQ